jgi:hypothetical protein|tara:strand:+ start:249 stop:698 length:450 start_codon:yes stop_codon:yes gene_type:complete
MIHIHGYSGKYSIDEDGNIYSKPKKRLLKPSLSVRGYMVVNVSGKVRPIHQLLAETFLDKDYKSKGLVVDHIDRNKTNNNLSNLRIVNRSENSINSDIYDTYKGHVRQRKSGSYRAFITIRGVRSSKTFKTEKEANQYLKTIQNENRNI